jgi:hypothetical protein
MNDDDDEPFFERAARLMVNIFSRIGFFIFFLMLICAAMALLAGLGLFVAAGIVSMLRGW